MEAFVLVNLAFLSVDIYLAHSVNQFRRWPEYVPLYFSLAAPVVLLVGLLAGEVLRLRVRPGATWAIWSAGPRWRLGWSAWSCTWTADFSTIGPSKVWYTPRRSPPRLAYTGLGLLLIMNRMVASESPEWPRWVLLLTLGGFFGNFLFSLTDHAQNGFFHWTEWIPVVSSAFAVGFLAAPFCHPRRAAILVAVRRR